MTCCSNGFWIQAVWKRLISISTFARNAAAKSFATSRTSTAKNNVAQIGTFGTLAARAAIRDVGRALGHSAGHASTKSFRWFRMN